ncbi:MAG: hypothetical protein ACI9EW_003809 [Cellvibrionaceae bacterium]|jgi:hypothetical protein
MLTISHNEIVVACRKALEVLGFSLGQAEDGADAIGWLAVHGLSLPRNFLNRIENLRPTGHFPKVFDQTPEKSAWDAHGESALSYFSTLADYAFVQAQQNTPSHSYFATIHNMPDIDLMWPYLGNIQRRGYHALILWCEADGTACQASFNQDHFKPEVCWFDSALIPANEIWLTISQSSLALSNQANLKTIRIESGLDFQRHYLNHTKDGIVMGEDTWVTLNKISKGLLVAATAESEKRGAGGA